MYLLHFTTVVSLISVLGEPGLAPSAKTNVVDTVIMYSSD